MNGRIVAALGVTQVIGYGTLYYAFPIAVPAISQTHDVSETWLYGVFSVGMLLGGMVAPRVGRAMDRYGAPRVMMAGSALVAGLLALIPLTPGWLGITALLLALQLVSVTVLYDGAFATLALLRGAGARRAITHLTLIAGFASTVFWPLTGQMIAVLGWQTTYGVFAALHLVLALPLHGWLTAVAARQRAVERTTVAAPKPESAPPPMARPGAPARAAFWMVAVGFAVRGMVIAAIGVHMVPLLTATGLGSAAYLVAMVMGPSQVAIRATDALFWKALHPVDVALISAVALPLALGALLVAGWLEQGQIAAAVLFSMLFGVGQGLSSIVHGTLPLALFGSVGFGQLLGRLSAVRSTLAAVAPFLFAVLMAWAGAEFAMGVAAGFALIAIVPFVRLRNMLRQA